jgi:hypothetical protein
VSQERLSCGRQGFVVFLSIVRVPIRDWVAETHQCRINRWFAKDTRHRCDIGLKIRFFDKHVGRGEGVRIMEAQVIYAKNVFNMVRTTIVEL